jgi:hypothetical protein
LVLNKKNANITDKRGLILIHSILHKAENYSASRRCHMILAVKEYLAIFRDRDYLTILILLIFCLSFIGVVYNIFSIRDSGLFLMTAVLSRFLSILRLELASDSLMDQLLDRIYAERSTPGFTNGNLSRILNSEFPKFGNKVKMKCMRELQKDMEVEMNPAGEYTFYAKKVFKAPVKDFTSGPF